jgi:hypothetical protein
LAVLFWAGPVRRFERDERAEVPEVEPPVVEPVSDWPDVEDASPAAFFFAFFAGTTRSFFAFAFAAAFVACFVRRSLSAASSTALSRASRISARRAWFAAARLRRTTSAAYCGTAGAGAWGGRAG